MYRIFSFVILLCAFGSVAAAQTGLSLQGDLYDPTLPVEITSDALTVDQSTQAVVFEGNAQATQGSLVISADSLTIEYLEETGDLKSILASGNVIYRNGSEEGKSHTAFYDAKNGLLTMEGSVSLQQGSTFLTANKLVLNLETNGAELIGNVRTRFVPQN